MVKSPRGDYVRYTETARPATVDLLKAEKVNSLWLYSKNIGYKREYTNVTKVAAVTTPPTVAEIPEVKSTFYYFNNPDTAAKWDDSTKLTDQQLQIVKNRGEFYIWDLADNPTKTDCLSAANLQTFYPTASNFAATDNADERRCIQIMYRNGSQAIYKQTAKAQNPIPTTNDGIQIPVWTFHNWAIGPLYLWDYITETYTYTWNRTSGSGSTLTWALDKESTTSSIVKTYTQLVTGYELNATTNKTVYRYLTSEIKKTDFFNVVTNPNLAG